MKKKEPTCKYVVLNAACWDAGERSRKERGGESWTIEDYNAACREYERLFPSPKEETK